MDKLFLLKPDFIDKDSLLPSQKYFCPPCAFLTGMLTYYPELRNQLEIIYVDYPRPRNQVIELIGADNQSCPVLILEDSGKDSKDVKIQKSGNLSFINDDRDIAIYLSKKYNVGLPH